MRLSASIRPFELAAACAAVRVALRSARSCTPVVEPGRCRRARSRAGSMRISTSQRHRRRRRGTRSDGRGARAPAGRPSNRSAQRRCCCRITGGCRRLPKPRRVSAGAGRRPPSIAEPSPWRRAVCERLERGAQRIERRQPPHRASQGTRSRARGLAGPSSRCRIGVRRNQQRRGRRGGWAGRPARRERRAHRCACRGLLACAAFHLRHVGGVAKRRAARRRRATISRAMPAETFRRWSASRPRNQSRHRRARRLSVVPGVRVEISDPGPAAVSADGAAYGSPTSGRPRRGCHTARNLSGVIDDHRGGTPRYELEDDSNPLGRLMCATRRCARRAPQRRPRCAGRVSRRRAAMGETRRTLWRRVGSRGARTGGADPAPWRTIAAVPERRPHTRTTSFFGNAYTWSIRARREASTSSSAASRCKSRMSTSPDPVGATEMSPVCAGQRGYARMWLNAIADEGR